MPNLHLVVVFNVTKITLARLSIVCRFRQSVVDSERLSGSKTPRSQKHKGIQFVLDHFSWFLNSNSFFLVNSSVSDVTGTPEYQMHQPMTSIHVSVIILKLWFWSNLELLPLLEASTRIFLFWKCATPISYYGSALRWISPGLWSEPMSSSHRNKRNSRRNRLNCPNWWSSPLMASVMTTSMRLIRRICMPSRMMASEVSVALWPLFI